MVGDISPVSEHTGLLFHTLQAILLVVVELVQIGVKLEMTGFLDHIFAVLGRCMGAGGKLKLVQVLCQMPDLHSVFRLGHGDHCAQFLTVIVGEAVHDLCQLIELVDAFILKIQRHIHFIGEHTLVKPEAHILRVSDAGAGHGTLDLTFGRGKVDPCDVFGVLRLQPGGQCHHEHRRLIEVCREVLSIIGLFQLHAVVINHAVAGHRASTAVNEQEGGFLCVQIFQLLYAGTAAVGIHIVVTANGFQVREVCDNGGFLTAEGQVDEVFHVGQIQLLGHSLKLCGLANIKAVQPLGQIVQLVQVDRPAFQPGQHRPCTADLIHMAVLGRGIADLQRLHQLDTVVELLSGDGKRDGRNAVFRVAGVAQYCLHHCLISPVFPSKFKIASPYLARSRAQIISWNASSVTSSGYARSAVVMLRLPMEMAFAAW